MGQTLTGMPARGYLRVARGKGPLKACPRYSEESPSPQTLGWREEKQTACEERERKMAARKREELP